MQICKSWIITKFAETRKKTSTGRICWAEQRGGAGGLLTHGLGLAGEEEAGRGVQAGPWRAGGTWRSSVRSRGASSSSCCCSFLKNRNSSRGTAARCRGLARRDLAAGRWRSSRKGVAAKNSGEEGERGGCAVAGDDLNGRDDAGTAWSGRRLAMELGARLGRDAGLERRGGDERGDARGAGLCGFRRF